MSVALVVLATTAGGCGARGHGPSATRAVTQAVPRPVLTGAHACPGHAGFTCSTLRVPLDHAGEARGTLTLAVGSAMTRAAPRGILLFVTGGPGQPGIPFLTRIQTRLRAELAGYRLVMFDQRGTGAGAL